MDTSDAWIQERTGIKERRYADRTGETTTTMGVAAAAIAIERAGITPQDIDFIVFATLSPDYYFPGCGVLLQRAMKMKEIGALDVRNQCSGFLYALSVADQFIKTGMYKNILVVGSEKHSFGLDFSRHTGVNRSALAFTFGSGIVGRDARLGSRRRNVEPISGGVPVGVGGVGAPARKNLGSAR